MANGQGQFGVDEQGKGRLNNINSNFMSSNSDSCHSKEMGKKVHADFVTVLEALKANGCISEYSIIGHEIKVEWKEGGIECAFRELTSNIKPFGLAKSKRGILMQVLPKKEQGEIYSAFIDQYSQ